MNAATSAELLWTARPSFALPSQVAEPQCSASSRRARLSTCTSCFDVLGVSNNERTVSGMNESAGAVHCMWALATAHNPMVGSHRQVPVEDSQAISSAGGSGLQLLCVSVLQHKLCRQNSKRHVRYQHLFQVYLINMLCVAYSTFGTDAPRRPHSVYRTIICAATTFALPPLGRSAIEVCWRQACAGKLACQRLYEQRSVSNESTYDSRE